ncbi:SDR family oxidoreductase [Sorangium sp. So ce363]|uniref:SDR family oxidoreductase n=1 Tax=Sorangium sp. So ce363 TaxID=3133304 RepID=UPI003F6053AB
MILVSGATGTIGRAMVRQLKARGAPFRAMVRSAEKGASLACDVVVGDFDRPETLSLAMAGIDALFLNGPAGEKLVRQQTAAIEAACAAGVKRIVKISSRGADASSDVGIARAHGVAEQVLASSGVEWSVLRPGTFMQNLLRNAGTIRSEGKIFGAYKDGRISFVDCEDIAECGIELLVGAGHAGKIYTLSGPEGVTFGEIAAKLSRVLEKPVTYVDLPPEQMVAGMKASGMPAPFAELMVKLMVAFSTGGGAQTTGAVRDLIGRPARSFDQFLADNVASFR